MGTEIRFCKMNRVPRRMAVVVAQPCYSTHT